MRSQPWPGPQDVPPVGGYVGEQPEPLIRINGVRPFRQHLDKQHQLALQAAREFRAGSIWGDPLDQRLTHAPVGGTTTRRTKTFTCAGLLRGSESRRAVRTVGGGRCGVVDGPRANVRSVSSPSRSTHAVGSPVRCWWWRVLGGAEQDPQRFASPLARGWKPWGLRHIFFTELALSARPTAPARYDCCTWGNISPSSSASVPTHTARGAGPACQAITACVVSRPIT